MRRLALQEGTPRITPGEATVKVARLHMLESRSDGAERLARVESFLEPLVLTLELLGQLQDLFEATGWYRDDSGLIDDHHVSRAYRDPATGHRLVEPDHPGPLFS